MIRFKNPSIGRLRLFVGCALMLLPFISIVLSAIWSYPEYPPDWEFAQVYPAWYALLYKSFVDHIRYPVPWIAIGPSFLAGFLLVRFKSRWFAIPAFLAFLWFLYWAWGCYMIAEMAVGDWD